MVQPGHHAEWPPPRFSVWRPGGQTGLELRMKSLADNVERTVRVNDTARGEAQGLSPAVPRWQTRRVSVCPPESEGRGRGGGQRSPEVCGSSTSRRWTSALSVDEPRASVAGCPTGGPSDGRFIVDDARAAPRSSRTRPAWPSVCSLAPRRTPSQMKVVTTRSDPPCISRRSRPTDDGSRSCRDRRSDCGRRLKGWPVEPSRRTEVPGETWMRTFAQGQAPLVVGRPVLYFTSARGGLLNVWAVDFDPRSG